MKTLKLLLTAAALSASGFAHAATTISNAPTGGAISVFGVPNSRTYGQTFTAPITGKLTSFTLWLNGGVGALRGGVGTWNGGASHSFGAGSPTNLYLSGDTPSLSGGPYTFSPNVNVTAGQNYVAYLTAFGVSGANSATSMPLGTAATGLNYFVWNNTSNPSGNSSWNYFFNVGNAQFSATFAAVPEPTTWALMILGFGAVGSSMRRKVRASAGVAKLA